MTKTALIEALENLQFAAPCPGCMDTPTPGLVDTPENQQGPGSTGKHRRGAYKGLVRSAMPICDLCKGKGVVYLNRICECGLPGVVYNSAKKLWTCGSPLCVEHAIWRAGLHGSAAAAQTWNGALNDPALFCDC